MAATVFGEHEYKLLLCGMNCVVLLYSDFILCCQKKINVKKRKLMLLIIYY